MNEAEASIWPSISRVEINACQPRSLFSQSFPGPLREDDIMLVTATPEVGLNSLSPQSSDDILSLSFHLVFKRRPSLETEQERRAKYIAICEQSWTKAGLSQRSRGFYCHAEKLVTKCRAEETFLRLFLRDRIFPLTFFFSRRLSTHFPTSNGGRIRERRGRQGYLPLC